MSDKQMNKITGTPGQRKAGKIGCLVAVVALAVIALIFSFADAGSESSRPIMKSPVVSVDTNFLPVLGVTLTFDNPPATSDFISAIAEAVHAQANRARSSAAEARSLTAINFEVRNAADANQLLLHFTIKGAEFYRAAEANRPAPFYLTLTQEAGANHPVGKDAAREYCGAANIAFCNQVLGIR